MKPRKIKMSAEEYHAHFAVGSTSLRTLIKKSPAHYLYEKTHPSESTPAQSLGTAIHQAILEPDLFKKNAVVEPEFSGKGSREMKDNWYTENHGKTILKRDQFDTIQGVLESLLTHPYAKKVLAAGHAEESLFWTHESGVELKARPDFLRENHIVVDIKSTTDCGDKFKKQVGEYLYHVQAALYLDAASAVFGKPFDEFVIVAVEKEPPFAVNCFFMEPNAINEGRALYYNALNTLAGCIRKGHFPGYSPELKSLELPNWSYE